MHAAHLYTRTKLITTGPFGRVHVRTIDFLTIDIDLSHTPTEKLKIFSGLLDYICH